MYATNLRSSKKPAVTNLTAAQKKKYNNYDNMHYMKQLKNFHELQELKAASVNYRRNMINRQKIVNYRNEIDRIDGVLSQSVFKHFSHAHLKKRKDQLNEMIKNIN